MPAAPCCPPSNRAPPHAAPAQRLQRQYSLAGDSRERNRYVLGVGRAADSRGGSEYLHPCCAPAPRSPAARRPTTSRWSMRALPVRGRRHRLTPILSMVRGERQAWKLVYAARSRVRMGFYRSARLGSRVRIHCDDEQGGPLAVAALMSDVDRDAGVLLRPGAPDGSGARDGAPGCRALHFDGSRRRRPTSAPPPAAWSTSSAAAPACTCRRNRASSRCWKPRPRVPFSCREGLCGTCETAVAKASPITATTSTRRRRRPLRTMLVCVSRASRPARARSLVPFRFPGAPCNCTPPVRPGHHRHCCSALPRPGRRPWTPPRCDRLRPGGTIDVTGRAADKLRRPSARRHRGEQDRRRRADRGAGGEDGRARRHDPADAGLAAGLHPSPTRSCPTTRCPTCCRFGAAVFDYAWRWAPWCRRA